MMPCDQVYDEIANAASKASEGLRTVLFVPQPLYVDTILIVTTRQDAPWLQKLLARDSAFRKATGHLIYVSETKLYELAFPDPFSLQTFGFSYWARNEGVVIWGENICHHIPVFKHRSLLLPYHLSVAIHQVRSHLILSLLGQKRYAFLAQRLMAQMRSILVSALLAKGIWKVFRHTLVPLFLEAYAHTVAAGCVLGFMAEANLVAQTDDATLDVSPPMQMVWKFEVAVSSLWEICDDQQ